MEKVNLAEKLAGFSDTWSPKIVGAVNDFRLKLVELRGEFVWQAHQHGTVCEPDTHKTSCPYRVLPPRVPSRREPRIVTCS